MSEHVTDSAARTQALAAELASTLVSGDIVLLSGDLGAGKSTFVRGAALALGVAEPVTSPTFTLGNLYQTDREYLLAHLDLYRLGGLATEDPDLLADYVGPHAVAFVEWPGVGEHALADLGTVRYRIHLAHAGGDQRTITVL